MTQTEFSTQLPARGRGMKFTPERIPQIRNLVERGKRREEIAELIGVTVRSLQSRAQGWGSVCGELFLTRETGLLRRDRPHSDSRGGSLLMKQAQALHQGRARTNGADLANLALRMQYRGHERIIELPLTQDMNRTGQAVPAERARGPWTSGLTARAIASRNGRPTIRATLLPTISISRFTPRYTLLRFNSCTNTGCRMALDGPCSSQSSGYTWNDSRTSLISGMLRLSYSALVILREIVCPTELRYRSSTALSRRR